jgi:hypothetical protein
MMRTPSPRLRLRLPKGTAGGSTRVAPSKAVSQLLWSGKDPEEWFSLIENHVRACRFRVTPIATLLLAPVKCIAVEFHLRVRLSVVID